MKDFRDLVVWQKSHKLTLDVYEATRKFPKEELYGLIPCNIAEGCGRRGNGEFHRFLQIATGSASEVEYELLLAHELGYLNSTEFTELSKAAVEVKRMLAGLISKVEAARMVSTH